MITALYASVLAVLLVWLAIQVIKQRRVNKVAYADGGVESLQIYPFNLKLQVLKSENYP